MNAEEFRVFVTAASIRAVWIPGRIGRLVLTRITDNGETILREPEMRHALAQEAESQANIFYGVEVPTRAVYRFTTAPGEQETKARHDFVVMADSRHDAERLNLLELKRDQPKQERSRNGDAARINN